MQPDVADVCRELQSLTHVRVTIYDWKTEYTQQRRHSALGYLTPARYAEICNHQ